MSNRRIAVYTDFDELDISPGRALLEEHGWEVRILATTEPEQIIAGAQDAQALLVGYAAIDERVIASLPNLKILALLSIGFDNVDVGAATDRGIWVSNVPGEATHEVASHALALSLVLSRQVTRFDADVRDGRWGLLSSPTPKALHEHTVSVLGFGRIGRAFAHMAAGVFRSVLAYDPYVTELSDEDRGAGIELVTIDEALASANVLSLHMPLTTDTHQLLNEDTLSQLPRGAVVVNVSRGELIDETALARALDVGRVSAAGLDVLTQEPPSSQHPLVHRTDVILTPHIGFLSERTFVEYPLTQARNVTHWASHGRPAHPVNIV